MGDFTWGVDGEVLTFSFESPTNPLSINEDRVIHWAKRRKRLSPWKDQVLEVWTAIKDEPRVAALVGRHGVVLVELAFDRSEKQWESTRRDPHNYVGTMCKVIVDVLTDKATGSIKRGDKVIEKRLWPDDTPEWVTVLEPSLVRGTTCTVSITFDGDVV